MWFSLMHLLILVGHIVNPMVIFLCIYIRNCVSTLRQNEEVYKCPHQNAAMSEEWDPSKNVLV